jgi:hypothetical protein
MDCLPIAAPGATEPPPCRWDRSSALTVGCLYRRVSADLGLMAAFTHRRGPASSNQAALLGASHSPVLPSLARRTVASIGCRPVGASS